MALKAGVTESKQLGESINDRKPRVPPMHVCLERGLAEGGAARETDLSTMPLRRRGAQTTHVEPRRRHPCRRSRGHVDGNGVRPGSPD